MNLKIFFATMFALIASSIHPNQFKQLQNNIGIVARVCKPDELLVDSGGWQLRAADFVARGFTPVRIVVDNQSDRAVLMSEHSTPYVPDIDALTSQFKRFEIGRPLGLIAGLYGFGTIVGGFVIHLANKYQARGLAALRAHPDFAIAWMASIMAATGWGMSILYSPFYWHRLREANKKLSGALMNALHPESFVIPSRHCTEKIILVHETGGELVQLAFIFKLFDEADDKLPVVQFYVDLDKRK